MKQSTSSVQSALLDIAANYGTFIVRDDLRGLFTEGKIYEVGSNGSVKKVKYSDTFLRPIDQ